MNDRELRMECLKLALASRPVPGLDKDRAPSAEDIVKSAETYIEFVTQQAPREKGAV